MTHQHGKANTTGMAGTHPERTALGLLAAAAAIAGVWGMVVSEDPGWPGISLRSGMILGAIWFSLPSLRRLRRGTWYALAAPTLVLLLRPRLILWGLALGAAIWVAGRRLGRPVGRGRTGGAHRSARSDPESDT